MSEDFTKAVTLKRNAKKKSGYTIAESDGEYFVGAVPEKARVNVGDKVVGVNGIRADEFEDEEDANGLIDSIRIVVVPAAEIDDYEKAVAAETPVGGDTGGGAGQGGVRMLGLVMQCFSDCTYAVFLTERFSGTEYPLPPLWSPE